VTPVRLWLHKERSGLFVKEKVSVGWDDNITVACQRCGNRFPVPEEKLELIRSINRNANLTPDQSPCLKLPSEAWKQPELFLECPICHKPLKLNPFIVDNSWKQERKESGFDANSKRSRDEKVQQWIHNGADLYSLGRYDEAIECYDKALELNPQDADAWSGKGGCLMTMGRYEEAVNYYNTALEINPQHTMAWSGKGGCLICLGRYNEAIECYDKALELNPKDALAWHSKGSCLMSLRRFRQAIECFDRALKISPQYAQTWFVKGVAEHQLGLRREAVVSYRRFIELASARHQKYVEIARSRLRELEVS
jgi:tetratricopeptide (TPR) repeat protein